MTKPHITNARDRKSKKYGRLHAQLTAEVIAARAACEAKNIVLPEQPVQQPWWAK